MILVHGVSYFVLFISYLIDYWV